MSEELTATPTASSEDALAQEIAAALTEPNVGLIRQLIAVIGAERAQAFLREAFELEAQGGLLRKDGKRRTPGGAFFYQVRGKLPPAERRQLWGYAAKKKRATPGVQPSKRRAAQPAAPVITLSWEQVQALFQQVTLRRP